MKIVTWNCNGALRKKFENLSCFDADLYIIQECENPEESNHKEYQKWASNYFWIGDSKNKGLGVFAKPDIFLEKLNWSDKFRNQTVKYFLPCKVNEQFTLLAVWTHRNNSPNFGYIGQLWKYLQVNKDLLESSIIAGDFNSSSIWDQWDRWWNHSDVVNELKEIGIESFYHNFAAEYQGKESKPTLYFRKNVNSKYHIDYIFGSEVFLEKIKRIEVGDKEEWLQISDHMPIFAEIDFFLAK